MNTDAISPLRRRMIEDMSARKLNPHTQRSHISSCKRFAAYLKRSPGKRCDSLRHIRRRTRVVLCRQRHCRFSQGGRQRPRALKFLNALARSQKPLVAAVGGVAIGIGTTMLFHFDHVVAGAGAVFSTPFLKLALIPEAASSLLAPTRMGYARAFSMLVMGRPLSAKVDDVALKAALEIAALPAGVIALARQLMRGHLDDVVERINTEAMHFKELLKSDEARAAFEAFLSRRK